MNLKFLSPPVLVCAMCVVSLGQQMVPTTVDGGLKFAENGRLLPSAFDKVVTFETDEDGKIKQPSIVYYVCAATGDDANDGKSASTPFRTIRKTMPLLAPGTAVRILPGEYDETFYENNKHGTREHPIWIGGYDPTHKGQRPVMKSPRGFLNMSRCSYIILHDMEITTPPLPGEERHRSGIHALNTSDGSNFVYRNLYVHHVHDSPFKFAGTNHYWLFDCEVSHDQQGLRGSGAIDNVGCHHNTVAYNYIHSGVGIGIVYKGGSANNDIYNNLIVNPGMSAITMGQSTGRDFFRPPLADNRTTYEAQNIHAYANIIIGGMSSFQMISSRGCYFVNNTVIHPQNWIFRILNNDSNDDLKLANFGNPHDNVIANNIFYYHPPSGQHLNVSNNVKPEDKKSIVISNNIFYNTTNPGMGGAPPNLNEFEVSSNRFIDPQFYDPANLPLTEESLKALTPPVLRTKLLLKDDSPAVGTGIDYPFAKEDHNRNPFANPRSLGAIEKNLPTPTTH